MCVDQDIFQEAFRGPRTLLRRPHVERVETLLLNRNTLAARRPGHCWLLKTAFHRLLLVGIVGCQSSRGQAQALNRVGCQVGESTAPQRSPCAGAFAKQQDDTCQINPVLWQPEAGSQSVPRAAPAAVPSSSCARGRSLRYGSGQTNHRRPYMDESSTGGGGGCGTRRHRETCLLLPRSQPLRAKRARKGPQQIGVNEGVGRRGPLRYTPSPPPPAPLQERKKQFLA